MIPRSKCSATRPCFPARRIRIVRSDSRQYFLPVHYYLLPIIYGSSAFTGVKPCFPEKILRKQTSRFASAKLFTWRKPNFTFCASRKLHDKRRFPIQEPPFIMACSVFLLNPDASRIHAVAIRSNRIGQHYAVIVNVVILTFPFNPGRFSHTTIAADNF